MWVNSKSGNSRNWLDIRDVVIGGLLTSRCHQMQMQRTHNMWAVKLQAGIPEAPVVASLSNYLWSTPSTER